VTAVAASSRFAVVAVPLPVDELYTYGVPAGVEVQPGHAVQVSFGRRRLTGYVVEMADQAPAGIKVKDIDRVIDPVPVLTSSQLEFCRWAADYYLSGLGEVIGTALPSPYRARARRVHIATTEGIAHLAQSEAATDLQTTVLRDVVSRPGRTRAGIIRALHGEAEPDAAGRSLDALVRAAHVVVEEKEPPAPGSRVTTVQLVADPNVLPPVRGVRMRGVLAWLVETGGVGDLPDLLEDEGAGARDAVKRLEAQGIVRVGDREDRSIAVPAAAGPPPEPPTLNDDQQAALDAINAGGAKTWVLHGVTGSGKTEVYLRAAKEVVAAGRQVVILVPEIGLTPQLLGRFQDRFGDRVAVLHSGLTGAERLREWRRIRAGEAEVAVGARSALFAPFHALGMIVVDEEHDDSYKQDQGVRYHARDLAVVRGHKAQCPVILGSATPGLETWQNARDGRYGLLSMPRRATPRALPQLELVDMRGRAAAEVLAPEVQGALAEALAAGGKAIVLYNRRGYAPVVECTDCGGHYTCPSCGVGMVYHQKRGTVTCHYCGYHVSFTSRCPTCGGAVEVQGHGTERIEEVLQELFPDVSIGRMDADTTRRRGAHAKILSAFREGETRLLVGTQVVAKGHDFPDVHVAAVVGVDHVLGLPDFRSAERTWALVTQMAGRAGRGDTAGRVLVQTRHADHFVFRHLAHADANADMDHFYTEESRQRRILGYPPFARLVLVRVEGADVHATRDRAGELARQLRGTVPRAAGRHAPVDVLGPVTAPLARLVGRWRFQLVLRGRDVRQFRRWLSEVRSVLRSAGKGGVRVVIDVDPRSLL
jgi:primosomal protein N' (replication factor Y) (superfamily II helicase)